MGSNVATKDGPCDDIGLDKEEDPRNALFRQLSIGQQKMATLPKTSVLQYLTGDIDDPAKSPDEWPILRCQNIFILPGVPVYFERKMKKLAAYLPFALPQQTYDVGLNVNSQPEKQPPLAVPLLPSRTNPYRIVLSVDEDSIVSTLNAAVVAHPHVSFGSYPLVNNPDCKTIITLEGRLTNGSTIMDNDMDDSSNGTKFFSKIEMERNLEIALTDLKSKLPEEFILSIDTRDDLSIK